MSILKTLLLSITFSFLASSGAWCQTDEITWPTVSREQAKKLRKEAHRYLFEEFLKGKQSRYRKDEKTLVEVTVFDGSTLTLDKIDLAEGTGKVAGMFQSVALKGENLDKIKSVFLKPYWDETKLLSLKGKAASSEERVFRLPPFPVPHEDISGLSVVVEADKEFSVLVEKILLRSEGKLGKDFQSYIKAQQLFPEQDNAFGRRQRNFYLETLNRSFEELAFSLDEQSESFAGVVFPSRMTPGLHTVVLNSMLTDRRVAKLYEGLQQQDAQTAARVSEFMLANELTSFKEKWNVSKILPARDKYAAEAHLFLCSEFCEPATLVKHVNDWNEWHKSNVKELGFQFKHKGNPDFRFLVNLYTNMVIKKNNFSIAQANKWVAKNVGPLVVGEPPKLEQNGFPSSDWTPNQIDLIKVVPTYQSYAGFPSKKKSQRLIIKMLETELLSP